MNPYEVTRALIRSIIKPNYHTHIIILHDSNGVVYQHIFTHGGSIYALSSVGSFHKLMDDRSWIGINPTDHMPSDIIRCCLAWCGSSFDGIIPIYDFLYKTLGDPV